jgi:hypothetical protein
MDILLWPTLDISKVAIQTGVLFYTLSFIVADASKSPSWGGLIPLSDNFYSTQLSNLRKIGGDAIVAFGGAIGTVNNDVFLFLFLSFIGIDF